MCDTWASFTNSIISASSVLDQEETKQLDTMDKADLSANAIYRCDITNELVCSLCVGGSRKKGKCTLKPYHHESPQHILKLDRFKNSFDNINGHIICKSCKSKVKWKNLQMHAASHKIVPWYEPSEKYKEFFANHMFRFSTFYHCHLCEELFLSWYHAYVHLNEETHVERMKRVSTELDTLTNVNESKFQNWVGEGFVPAGGNSIHCEICDLDLDVADVDCHSKNCNHTDKRLKLICWLNKLIETVELHDRIRNPPKAEKVSTEKVKVVVETPKVIAPPLPRAMICNFHPEPNTTSDNETPDKYDVSPADVASNVVNDWYSVNFPKIDTADTIFPRISPKVSEEREHLPHAKTPSTDVAEASVNFLVDKFHPLCEQHMAKLKKNKWKKLDTYCLICTAINYKKADTLKHASSKQHVNTLKNCGCENIVAVNGSTYYCKCCDHCMENLSKVYHHVKSKEHMRFLDTNVPGNENSTAHKIKSTDDIDGIKENDMNDNLMPVDEKSPPLDENSTSSRKVTSAVIDVEPCLYIVKQNAKKSFCQICDINELPIATKNVIKHAQTQRHALALTRYGCDKIERRENGSYHCSCCNVDVENVSKIHLHIKDKKHMSSLIKVKQETRDCTKIASRTTSPELNRQSSKKNFLCDYIANIDPTIICDNKSELSEGKYDQENFKQPQLRSILTSMASEVSRLCRQIEKDKEMRQSAKTAVDKAENRARRNENNLAKSIELIVCPTCGCSVLNLTELHSHVAQHFHEDFVTNTVATNDQFDFREGEATIENHNGALETTSDGQISDKSNFPDEIICNGTSTAFDSPEFDQSASPDPAKSIQSINSIKVLEKLFRSNNFIRDHPLCKAQCDVANGHDDESLQMELLKNWKCKKTHGKTPRKVNMKKVMQALNFDDDTIYNLKHKLSDMALGFRLSLIVDSETIYCLICRKTVSNRLQNYYDHLWTVDHCQNLEMMEQDDSLFLASSDLYSDLKLAQEYMEEMSEKHVHCFICNTNVRNNDESLRNHIYDRKHERTCDMMTTNALANFNEMRWRLNCDWYSVQNYWCVPCFYAGRDEVSFAKHLESDRHKHNICNLDNRNKKIMLDYCSTCSLLLCGYRVTHAHHVEISVHKWLERDGYYIIDDLPEFAKMLLAEPEKYVNEKIRYLDEISQDEIAKEDGLVYDLVEIVKQKFPRVKAYTFGSRETGLGSEDSDLDVFLDCRNMYDGSDSSLSVTLYFITGIHMCLKKHPDCWDVNELLVDCRSPIIRACHRATGLACDISVEDGLAVENTKLIRSFNNVYPTCRKLTLILKQWLAYCDLSGSERITSYALNWLVIFYLQIESILPSVATLTAKSKKSRIIAGWETAVSKNFSHWEPKGNMSIKDLMKRFFAFYADFDYRRDVACPLLGEILQKRDFVDPSNLPKEMKRYVLYMKNTPSAEAFRIDSAMCIQDPFDLQHNLTKAVGKIHLNRFRTYCSKSFHILSSHETKFL